MIGTRSNDGRSHLLTINGSMTLDFSNELEERILHAMRQHPCLKVDLSGVCEIDLCGIRLLRLLQTLGGKDVDIVAMSPTVAHAIKDLPGIKNLVRACSL